MSSKLSIASEMRALDTKDRKWWDTLDEDDQIKMGKSMWTQQRWASSVSGSMDSSYLVIVNEYADFNTLKAHPQLQHQLLQIAGVGKTQRHEWIPPGKAGKKNKLTTWLATQFPQFNDDELELLASITDKAEFKDRMEQQDMTKKEIKDILK